MPLGVGWGQNLELGDFCNILTLVPPGASVLHKHMSSSEFTLMFQNVNILDILQNISYGQIFLLKIIFLICVIFKIVHCRYQQATSLASSEWDIDMP